MIALLPKSLLSLAAIAALSVLAPAARAGDGDLGKALRFSSAVCAKAEAAARFGVQVGRPDYVAFARTSSLIAKEAHTVTAKLKCGDIAAAKL
ncbi:MAG: hypothetical protein AAF907_14075, partial [Planctomycetota bacterium]